LSKKLPAVEGSRLVEHPGLDRRTTVHVHRGSTIKRGTLAAILDDTGLTVEDLESLL
jgi:predicted RNA binding protein YcfA (HicA-like mRNA interferase family)